MKTENATVKILKSIVESVRASGEHGIPGGTLYAALMTHGCTLEQFENLMSTLVRIHMIEKRGYFYFAVSSPQDFAVSSPKPS